MLRLDYDGFLLAALDELGSPTHEPGAWVAHYSYHEALARNLPF